MADSRNRCPARKGVVFSGKTARKRLLVIEKLRKVTDKFCDKLRFILRLVVKSQVDGEIVESKITR